jgi:hypothetical protein
MKFFVLDGKPAVLLEDRGRAYVLHAPQPSGRWIATDRSRVQRIGRLLDEPEWRTHFRASYGHITLANPRPPANALVTLVMGRTFKRCGERFNEPEFWVYGEVLEERAQAALEAGKDVLDPLQ